ncbi:MULTISPECIES: hypothetical protein [Holospora]|uniref:ATP synthase subunit b n=2 Tax=Holospora TaxID=44747 RepID=A0A061JHE2_9PROT|nr:MULTISPECIES: hypothetical protein [Holospora]ETZ04742.1 hypothetical protein K737_300844 [Holospora undulata HU1]GAJ46617.1 hypothetical protein HE1_00953 [Holospora elegans E1]
MGIDNFFDATFMVGLAFVLLCGGLAKPGWGALMEKLKVYTQSITQEFQKADRVLKEAEDRLEYAQAILEQFETKKQSLLHHMEQHIVQMEKIFQQDLVNKENWEHARFKTQCQTLFEEWKQDASQRFMKELNTQLIDLLQKDMSEYVQLNSTMFHKFLKEYKL